MKTFAALLLALVSGCTSEDVADWYGDREFTAKERADVEAGFAWDAEHAGRPVPTILWTLDRDSQALPHTIRREKGPQGNHNEATGFCSGSRTIYLFPEDRPEINAPWDEKYMQGLAAHELLHCWFGFQDDYHDSYSGTGIMGTIWPMTWSAFEEAECERTHCRP